MLQGFSFVTNPMPQTVVRDLFLWLFIVKTRLFIVVLLYSKWKLCLRLRVTYSLRHCAYMCLNVCPTTLLQLQCLDVLILPCSPLLWSPSFFYYWPLHLRTLIKVFNQHPSSALFNFIYTTLYNYAILGHHVFQLGCRV